MRLYLNALWLADIFLLFACLEMWAMVLAARVWLWLLGLY